MLDWTMPTKSVVTFLSKVTANQLLLAPCTLTTVFAWNLALSGKADAIPEKIKQDLVPTMINGKSAGGSLSDLGQWKPY